MPVPILLDEIRSLALNEIHALTEIHSEITPLLYREGEWLLQETDASQDIFIILRGTYVVEQLWSGVVLDKVTCDVESFSIIGEMAYLGGQQRTASVRAITECHALRLSSNHLETVIERFPMLTRVICRQFANRLKAANEAISNLMAHQVPAEQLAASAEPGEARSHLIAPGSWNLKVGRKGRTLCGLRIPESTSLLHRRDPIGICKACEVALDREELWPKM